MYQYNIENRNDTKIKWKEMFKKLLANKKFTDFNIS